MIIEVKMFTVKCDNCGKQFTDDGSSIVAWSDAANVEDMATDSDWFKHEEQNDVHYCPSCWTLDEDDKLHLSSVVPFENEHDLEIVEKSSYPEVKLNQPFQCDDQLYMISAKTSASQDSNLENGKNIFILNRFE